MRFCNVSSVRCNATQSNAIILLLAVQAHAQEHHSPIRVNHSTMIPACFFARKADNFAIFVYSFLFPTHMSVTANEIHAFSASLLKAPEHDAAFGPACPAPSFPQQHKEPAGRSSKKACCTKQLCRPSSYAHVSIMLFVPAQKR